MCLHVGELSVPVTKRVYHPHQEKRRGRRRNLLPEFSCMHLSPANYWHNDAQLFVEDADIMSSFATKSEEDDETTDDEPPSTSTTTTKPVKAGLKSTRLRDILFGVKWANVLTSLDEHVDLHRRVGDDDDDDYKRQAPPAVVLSYAITIALRKYDRAFLAQLESKLRAKLQMPPRAPANDSDVENANYDDDDDDDDDENDRDDYEEIDVEHDKGRAAASNVIINLKYARPNFFYYIPYICTYALLFLYIYFSVFVCIFST